MEAWETVAPMVRPLTRRGASLSSASRCRMPAGRPPPRSLHCRYGYLLADSPPQAREHGCAAAAGPSAYAGVCASDSHAGESRPLPVRMSAAVLRQVSRRRGLCAAAMNGCIYAAGGWDGERYLSSMERHATPRLAINQ